MADKTVDDLIRLREEARKRVTEAMAAVARGGRIDSGLAARELDRMIAAQRERLDATRAAMANAMSRFESEVKQREARIAELKELRKQFAEPTPGPRLRDVKGIGPVAAERLEKNGITSLKILAETSPERLAEILERNEEAAKEIILEARRLLRS